VIQRYLHALIAVLLIAALVWTGGEGSVAFASSRSVPAPAHSVSESRCFTEQALALHPATARLASAPYLARLLAQFAHPRRNAGQDAVSNILAVTSQGTGWLIDGGVFLPPELVAYLNRLISSLNPQVGGLLEWFLHDPEILLVNRSTPRWRGQGDPKDAGALWGYSEVYGNIVPNRNLHLPFSLRIKGTGGALLEEGYAFFVRYYEDSITQRLRFGADAPRLRVEMFNGLAWALLMETVWGPERIPSICIPLAVKRIETLPWEGALVDLKTYFTQVMSFCGSAIRRIVDEQRQSPISVKTNSRELTPREVSAYVAEFIGLLQPAQLLTVHDAPARLNLLALLMAENNGMEGWRFNDRVRDYLRSMGQPRDAYGTMQTIMDNLFREILVAYHPPRLNANLAVEQRLEAGDFIKSYRAAALDANQPAAEQAFLSAAKSLGETVGPLWAVGGATNGPPLEERNIGILHGRIVIHDFDGRKNMIPTRSAPHFESDTFLERFRNDQAKCAQALDTFADVLGLDEALRKQGEAAFLSAVARAVETTRQRIIDNPAQATLNPRYVAAYSMWLKRAAAMSASSAVERIVLGKPAPPAVVIDASLMRRAVEEARASDVVRLPHVNVGLSESLPEQWQRLVAVSDNHADLQGLLVELLKAELINEQGNWIGGNSLLLVNGDFLNVGSYSREIWYYLRAIQRQARAVHGDVIIQLGNHEVMPLQDDFRQIERNPDVRAAGLQIHKIRREYKLLRDDLLNALAQGDVVAAFNVGDLVFVHAGVLPEYAAHLQSLYPHANPLTDGADFVRCVNEELRATARAELDGYFPDGRSPFETNPLFGENGLFWVLPDRLKQSGLRFNLAIGHVSMGSTIQVETVSGPFGIKKLIRLDISDRTHRTTHRGFAEIRGSTLQGYRMQYLPFRRAILKNVSARLVRGFAGLALSVQIKYHLVLYVLHRWGPSPFRYMKRKNRAVLERAVRASS